ncbi:PAS domain-containing sensor histidine kinase [Methylophilus methylotrophus]|uniref:PAS domain-containing sensor histidine kinase n=1 Tax=Methylophilus methylotrophus TaxID=17 RepID=UPI00037B76CF|nr:PAS domain S-box protein [Methylophilus methylotrophus]
MSEEIGDIERANLPFRQVVEAAPTAMVMVNKAGVIEMVNTQTELIFGYSRVELLGQLIDILLPERFRHQHPHHRASFFSDLSPRAMGTGRDLYGRRKDGSEFPVEVGLNPIETDDGVKVLSAITDISARKRMEERFRQVVEAAPNAMVMVNKKGIIEMVNTQAERIFGYSRAELLGQLIDILLPERFRHQHPGHRASFFSDLSPRAMGTGRDLKSPLRGIFQISHWIEEDLTNGQTDAIPQHMSLLRGRLRRMERLLDDLLAYSRAGRLEGSVSQVELGKWAQNIFEMQAPPEGFTLEVAADLPTLTTLATPLEQVLRNLFTNAIKHHDRPQGRIRLDWRAASKTYHEFSVTDDGPGISPEYQERVYLMFQTLRPRDEVEGSGMGLALVKKIVEAYGGTTSIVSDGIRGTTIRFTWPINIEERLIRANPAEAKL